MTPRNCPSLVAMLFVTLITAGNSGCGGGSATTPPLTQPAPPQTFIITTTSFPSGTVNASYSATLQSTGGKPPLTWSPTTGLPPGLALSSNGTISGTPTAPGFYCFEVLATDHRTPPQSPGQSLCIGINQPDSSHNALLKGHYAFFINWFEPSILKTTAQIATAGSFVADGAGNVTGGVSDTNGPGVAANPPFTGTYAFSVGSMSASGVATKGRMIRASGVSAAGEFELQDPSAFSNSAVSGSVAFEFSNAVALFGQGGAVGACAR